MILKIGHGHVKNKPELLINDIKEALDFIKNATKNQQYTFLIIESNQILDHLKPDLCFFVNSTTKEAKASAGTAIQKADILFSEGMDILPVKEKIDGISFFDPDTKAEIINIIEEFQADFILQQLAVKVKIWLDKDNKMVFGPGKYELLKMIRKTNSLNKAAKELKMSYRHAWAYIKTMEERLGQKVLCLKVENKKNSGSDLTALAKALISKYEHEIENIKPNI
ncbi:winged helix-turn-helix domain-containing protein [Candidatus Margulisiibacteriota bacterium]